MLMHKFGRYVYILPNIPLEAHIIRIHQRVFNTFIGGLTENIYLIVNSIGTPSGEGFDFVNGMAFIERFYSVYGKMTTNDALSLFVYCVS